MNRIISIALAAGFAAVSLCASAADLTDQDRSELRRRAQEFQNERSRNPNFQPGQGRVNAAPVAATVKSSRVTKSRVTKTGKKETRRHKAANKARSLKKIPGALVRK